MSLVSSTEQSEVVPRLVTKQMPRICVSRKTTVLLGGETGQPQG